MPSNEDLNELYLATGGGTATARRLDEHLASKVEAIAFLKNLSVPYTWGDKGLSPGDAWRLLANLGDKETIQSIYTSFREQSSNTFKAQLFVHGISRINHPALLSVMGPDLNQEGSIVSIPAETWGAYEVPFGNAFTFLRILEYSGFFSPEVVTWAKDIKSRHKDYRPDLYLRDIRAFWAENAAHIEAGEYNLVRPPSAASKPPEDPSPPEAPAPLPSEPKPEPVKLSVAAPMPTPATEPAPAAKTNPVWWIVGLIILAAGAMFLARKKPKA